MRGFLRFQSPAGARVGASAFRTLKLTAVLLLMISVIPGAAAGNRAAAAESPVDPAVVETAVNPGGFFTVDKNVTTPVIPPRPDVVLLVDGTGSMTDAIAGVKENLSDITTTVRSAQPDSRFAVATYRDVQENGDQGFVVLQELTDDLAAVQQGVNRLSATGGGDTPEDWINALWQVANGAGGKITFREGASPIVVLVGDAPSHDPSNGFTLDDATTALTGAGVRVLAVDVAGGGDGLDGGGQATSVAQATGGKLLQGTNSDDVASAIAEGLTNLPTTVGAELVDCDPSLTVTLDPSTSTVTSGETASFQETIRVSEDAPQGKTIRCTVQFAFGAQPPGSEEFSPKAAADPAYQQSIVIHVNNLRPEVAPAVVDTSLDPGNAVAVDKEVNTPVIPPRPDVVLLVDGTGSMADTISGLKGNLYQITNAVRAQQPDSRFAVATYRDQEVDGDKVFEVLQGLTDDLKAVQTGVDGLSADGGSYSAGPAEDWINALWQIANGADGRTVFREGASPIVVLVGDSSSHDPSKGHTLDDAIYALQDAGVRVLAVDLATDIGDGLNGNGDNGKGYADDPLHEPNQATDVVQATGGKLLQGIDQDQVAGAIAEGLTNLPTAVGAQLVDCDPSLNVVLDPPTSTVTSGDIASFKETITATASAPQGKTIRCTVQFVLGTQPSGSDTLSPMAAADPDYQESITIHVNDVAPPAVTVDDRTAEATSDDGVKINYTATAEDAVDGNLPVTCNPKSGSVFPVGVTKVSCVAVDRAGNRGMGTATFTVLAKPVPPAADVGVTTATRPTPNYVGRSTTATFTLTNAGPDPAQNVVVSTAWPRPSKASDRRLAQQSKCTKAAPCTIPAGGRVKVTQSAVYETELSGNLKVAVSGSLPDPKHGNNTDTAKIRILQPELTVTPQVARAGDVVLARGKDFPAGATVNLTWQPGITAAHSPVRVGGDGTFVAQVLIMRKDQLGPRQLRADVTDLDRLQEQVLVVPRNLQPPDFAGRN